MKLYGLKSIEDLKPSPTNPRTITEEAKSGLKYSVESFGDISGIVWNARSGNLVCGHQRVKVLTEAGAKLNADCDYLELQDGTLFPVRVVNWDEDKESAANLAANNQAIAGDWTMDVAAVIEGIKTSNPTHFDNLQLDEILGTNDFSLPDDNEEIDNDGGGETTFIKKCPKCGHQW